MNRYTFSLLFLLCATTSAQAGWQPNGIPVNTSTNNQVIPAVVSTNSGGIAVMWREDSAGSDPSIFTATLDGSGEHAWTGTRDWTGFWFAPTLQNTTVSDGAGGIIAVFTIHTSGDWDVVAQRIDVNGNTPWGAGGVPVCTATDDQEFPELVSDGAGGAICAWRDKRSDADGDLYAQRMDASGNMLWTSDGVELCTALGAQDPPLLVRDGAGGAVAVWVDHRAANDVYADRIDGSGDSVWNPNGLAVVTTLVGKVLRHFESDGVDGAIVFWSEPALIPEPDKYVLRTRRIDFFGNPYWPAGGAAVCTAESPQGSMDAIADGAGGAIVAWEDYRGSDADIYLGRIDYDGNLVWTTDGVPLCTAGGDQLDPVMTSDGAGGAIVAWTDYRGGPSADIFAGRVNTDGTSLWMPDGVPVCDEAGHQSNPAIASAGVGNAFVVWEDTRDGNSVIYAQRVESPTGVGDTPSLSTLTVLENAPNPFGTTTTLRIGLAQAGEAEIDLFDVVGHRLRSETLRLKGGWSNVAFDARDAHNRLLSTGVYFCRVRAGGQTATRKMVIAR